MIMYTVNTDSFAFNPKKYSTVEDAYFSRDDYNAIQSEPFATIEEARKQLETIDVTTYVYEPTYAVATVAYIEEADWEQDEDGEWQFISGSSYWDFKSAPIKGEQK